MRAIRDWSLFGSQGCYYVPACGNLGLAGDTYLFISPTTPGYISRIPNAMAYAPAVLKLGNCMNDIAQGYTGATINSNLNTVLAAVAAHANFSALERIILTTCPQRWQFTTAQDTARQIHNNYIRSLCVGNPLYVLHDTANAAGITFGDFGDNTHFNGTGSFKAGMYEGAVTANQFTGSGYPTYGQNSNAGIAITNISLANTFVRVTAPSHGLITGMPVRIQSFTNTFSPGIGNAKYFIIVVDANNFDLYGLLSSGITGVYLAGGTVTSGIAGTVGTNWTMQNTAGVTLTTSTDTYNGRSWLNYTVSGTATLPAPPQVGLTFGSVSKRVPGVVNDALIRLRITNGAGNDDPVGLGALQLIGGGGVSLGLLDAWNLVVQSASNSETISFDVYNANLIAPDVPMASMLTDWAGPVPPAYDIGQFRIGRISVTLPSSGVTTTTAAAAIVTLINGDANMIAAGITATSTANTVLVAQSPAGNRSGTLFILNATANISISPHPNPMSKMLVEAPGRIESGCALISANSTSISVFTTPLPGVVCDYRVWFSEPLIMLQETTAYQPPYAQFINAINLAPTVALVSDVATAQWGPWSGGGITTTYEWFVNNVTNNPTGGTIPAPNTAVNATLWTDTGFTDNPHNFTGGGFAGQFCMARVTATNSLGTAYQYTTKSIALT